VEVRRIAEITVSKRGGTSAEGGPGVDVPVK
jgi:hypothetical protein